MKGPCRLSGCQAEQTESLIEGENHLHSTIRTWPKGLRCFLVSSALNWGSINWE